MLDKIIKEIHVQKGASNEMTVHVVFEEGQREACSFDDLWALRDEERSDLALIRTACEFVLSQNIGLYMKVMQPTEAQKHNVCHGNMAAGRMLDNQFGFLQNAFRETNPGDEPGVYSFTADNIRPTVLTNYTTPAPAA